MTNHQEPRPILIKVGGSLFDLADLGTRLMRWLHESALHHVLLVPGGGPTADLIRDLDRRHRLGEERAHWLALRALSLNAHFLATILPGAIVVDDPGFCGEHWRAQRLPILDAYAFTRADEARPGCLPHSWSVTSDSVAARVAVVARAQRLLLLKSVDVPADMGWQAAGEQGFVDALFATVLRSAEPGLDVRAINLRAWSAAPVPPKA